MRLEGRFWRKGCWAGHPRSRGRDHGRRRRAHVHDWCSCSCSSRQLMASILWSGSTICPGGGVKARTSGLRRDASARDRHDLSSDPAEPRREAENTSDPPLLFSQITSPWHRHAYVSWTRAARRRVVTCSTDTAGEWQINALRTVLWGRPIVDSESALAALLRTCIV
ncbi:hypothetical protein BOTBODRAFT_368155 [Botryobasidium botryosum FD-172 SS1]|uniref:Uncharacterized protein n=1 Tax=Botryobasidium botryosum (strain FD-172 SS1) TaxID=930990 RepID=A0A067MCH0_BOTB1|nr:hypothetical protein BOTBODRAFT_368155 [Botryobasidium botryosum FD-172 SS1]